MGDLVERRLGWITVDGQEYPREQAADWLKAIENGQCPFCGAGPFVVVASHVTQRHGIDRTELRDWLGLPVSASICDPNYSKQMSALNRDAGSFKRFGKARRARTSPRVHASILKAQAIQQRTKLDEARQVLDSWNASGSVESLAVQFETTTQLMRARLRRLGVDLPDGRTMRWKATVDFLCSACESPATQRLAEIVERPEPAPLVCRQCAKQARTDRSH